MSISQPELTSDLHIGDGHQIDPGVLLGYMPGRNLPNPRLDIGSNAWIRSNSVIYAGSQIGKGLETGHGVVIREENQIGDHLTIWSNSFIDYGCVIGNRVRIQPSVYVAQYTTIEDEVFLAPGVMIANDPHPICGLCMKGPTIKKGARIGVNATLLSHIIIGEHALIGAGSVVTRDVPAHSVVYGNPARETKSVDELPCPFDLVDRPYHDGIDVHSRKAKPRNES